MSTKVLFQSTHLTFSAPKEQVLERLRALRGQYVGPGARTRFYVCGPWVMASAGLPRLLGFLVRHSEGSDFYGFASDSKHRIEVEVAEALINDLNAAAEGFIPAAKTRAKSGRSVEPIEPFTLLFNDRIISGPLSLNSLLELADQAVVGDVIIIERGKQHYAQATRDIAGFIFEKREGSAREHYACFGKLNEEGVANALFAYATGTPEAVTWEKAWP